MGESDKRKRRKSKQEPNRQRDKPLEQGHVAAAISLYTISSFPILRLGVSSYEHIFTHSTPGYPSPSSTQLPRADPRLSWACVFPPLQPSSLSRFSLRSQLLTLPYPLLFPRTTLFGELENLGKTGELLHNARTQPSTAGPN